MAEIYNPPMAFAFEDALVRTSTTPEGEILFVALDVLRALEYSDTSNPSKVLQHVPEEWKGVNPIHTLGGLQNALQLTEQGLYFFICRSDKPKALPFQKWIAGEVIPSIRKTGRYGLPDNKAITAHARLIEQAAKQANRWASTKDVELKQIHAELLTALYAQLGLDAPTLSRPSPSSDDAWWWLVKALLDEVENSRYKAPHKLEILAGREVLIFRTSHFIEHVAQRGGLREEWQRLGAISDRVWKKMLRSQGMLAAEETERAIDGKRVAHMVALDLTLARSQTG